MSNQGINRAGNLVWDDINSKWVPMPAPNSFLQTTQISGITPVGGNLPIAISGSSERFQTTVSSVDATSPVRVKAKTASKRMNILSIVTSVSGAMSVQFQDDAGTPEVLIGKIHLSATGGFVMNFPEQAPLVVATNQDFDVLTTAAGGVTVAMTGYLST